MKWALGVFVVILLGCCGGGTLIFNRVKDVVDGVMKESEAFGDKTLAAISVDWSPESLRASGLPESDINATKLTEWKAKLGSFKSGKASVTGLEGSSNTGSPSRVTVTYRSDAKFEKGNADVTLKLTKEEKSDWKLSDIDITPK